MSKQSQKYLIPNTEVMPPAELTRIMGQAEEQGIPVLIVPSPPKVSNIPHLFWLEYNHSKLPTKNAWTEARKLDMQSCWGTLYPDGGVSLSMGSYFGGIEDLKRYLEATGEYSITWLEEINKEKVS